MTSVTYFNHDLHNTVFSEEEVEEYFGDDNDKEKLYSALESYQELLDDYVRSFVGEQAEEKHFAQFFEQNVRSTPVTVGSKNIAAFLSTSEVEQQIEEPLGEDYTVELAREVINFYSDMVDEEYNTEGIEEYAPHNKKGVIYFLEESIDTYIKYSYEGEVAAEVKTTTQTELGMLLHEFMVDVDSGKTEATVTRFDPPTEQVIFEEETTLRLAGNASIDRNIATVRQGIDSYVSRQLEKFRTEVLVCERSGKQQNVEKGRYVLLPEEQIKRTRADGEEFPFFFDQSISTDEMIEFMEEMMGLSHRQAQAFVFTEVMDFSVKKAAEKSSLMDTDGEREDAVSDGSMKSARSRIRDKVKEAKSLLSVARGTSFDR